MIFCPNCGAPNQDHAAECVQCKTALISVSKPSKFKGTMVLQQAKPAQAKEVVKESAKETVVVPNPAEGVQEKNPTLAFGTHTALGPNPQRPQEPVRTVSPSLQNSTQDYEQRQRVRIDPAQMSAAQAQSRSMPDPYSDDVRSASVDALLTDLENSRPTYASSDEYMPSKKPGLGSLIAFLGIGFISVAGPASAVLGGLHLYDKKQQVEFETLRDKISALKAAVSVAAVRATCNARAASEWSAIEKSVCPMPEQEWRLLAQKITATKIERTSENCFSLHEKDLEVEGCETPNAGFTLQKIRH